MTEKVAGPTQVDQDVTDTYTIYYHRLCGKRRLAIKPKAKQDPDLFFWSVLSLASLFFGRFEPCLILDACAIIVSLLSCCLRLLFSFSLILAHKSLDHRFPFPRSPLSSFTGCSLPDVATSPRLFLLFLLFCVSVCLVQSFSFRICLFLLSYITLNHHSLCFSLHD